MEKSPEQFQSRWKISPGTSPLLQLSKQRENKTSKRNFI
jgi:hypothetical protein